MCRKDPRLCGLDSVREVRSCQSEQLTLNPHHSFQASPSSTSSSSQSPESPPVGPWIWRTSSSSFVRPLNPHIRGSVLWSPGLTGDRVPFMFVWRRCLRDLRRVGWSLIRSGETFWPWAPGADVPPPPTEEEQVFSTRLVVEQSEPPRWERAGGPGQRG
ncbi:hypothetical protein DPEC_G00027450 [Dallia pectoralis]|uniref:Uncharacterized protein n=1 Tax=Dallia pectoralis TaxID=75939 RepID=A0ACC2HHU2_DALPE|nr:hypothetical protein DPEC_G00027450 [Dallia pectoralis]